MRCKRNRNGKFNPGNRTVAKIIMGKSSHNGQRQASGIAVAPYNRLTEKEIRKKLPDRFFKKSKEKKEWLGEQVDFQNLNYEVTLIEPANTKKITKNTKRIVGRTMKNAYVELDCPSKGWKLKRVKADESGKFVMDNLDLRKWAGKTARFKISIRRSNGKIAGIKSDTEFKVKK